MPTLKQAVSRNAVVNRKSINATPEQKRQARQELAAARIETAVTRALTDAPKLSRDQANAIVALLMSNTEPPQAGWIENPGGEA